MDQILIRVRKYPWQWSSRSAKVYTASKLKAGLCLEYSGGELVEIHDSKLAEKISLLSKNFFFPVIKEVHHDDGKGEKDYSLFGYTYYLPDKIKDIKIEISSGEKIVCTLSNTLPKNEENSRELETYLSIFDEMKARNSDGVNSDILFDVCLDLLGDGKERPTYSFIASIADPLLKLLPQIKSAMRKILVGKQVMLPISKVRELDQSCITFLIKKPGETLEEKVSANNFKLKAVARVEKYDLLENRVLKNFLIRAQKECRKYVEDYPKGSKSERVRKVRIVGSKIKEILSLPVMASITEQTSLPTPNYVLQSERKYNAIWKYYINLVRKEKQLEKSFLYQDNTFRNMVELLLQGALQHLSQGKEKVSFEIREIGTSVLDINQEQQLGVRVKSQALGPFLITKKNGSSYYVRLTTDAFISDKHGKEIYPKYASLKYLGTKSFIIVYGITSKGIDPKAIFLIPVYAVNAIQCEHPETPEKIFADACSELELAQKLPDMNKYKLGGIVLTNHRDHSEEKFFKNGCALFAFSDVPSEWGYNAISLSSFIATYLEQLLK